MMSVLRSGDSWAGRTSLPHLDTERPWLCLQWEPGAVRQGCNRFPGPGRLRMRAGRGEGAGRRALGGDSSSFNLTPR